MTFDEFKKGAMKWQMSIDDDPTTWSFGDLERGPSGSFDDDELLSLLNDGTEDVAGMPNLNLGNVVDPLDGGKVVAKGKIMSVDPSSTAHGQPLRIGHSSLLVVWVLKGNTYIPHIPPHKPELCTLGHIQGYIIAWPHVALAICLQLCNVCLHICMKILYGHVRKEYVFMFYNTRIQHPCSHDGPTHAPLADHICQDPLAD